MIHYLGIDVSCRTLEVSDAPGTLTGQFANTSKGVASLLGWVHRPAFEAAPEVLESLERTITALEKEAAQVTRALEARVEAHPRWQQEIALLTTVPGIGVKTAILLVSELPAQARCKSAKAWVAFCGVNTARDVVSRWDVIEVHTRATATTAAGFLDRLLLRMPFPVRAIQVDGGSEFQAAFETECQRRGLHLFVLPPHSPKLNGSVERAQRTHTEEFYEVTNFSLEVTALNQELLAWEHTCNTSALSRTWPASPLTNSSLSGNTKERRPCVTNPSEGYGRTGRVREVALIPRSCYTRPSVLYRQPGFTAWSCTGLPHFLFIHSQDSR